MATILFLARPVLADRGSVASWRALVDLAFAWSERTRQRRALARLDDRLLADIGLGRSEALREAEKPFWMA